MSRFDVDDDPPSGLEPIRPRRRRKLGQGRRPDMTRVHQAADRDGRPVSVRLEYPDDPGCSGKYRRDKDSARREARRLNDKHPDEPVDWYRCRSCGSYHVGHRSQDLTTAEMKAAKRSQRPRPV